MRSSASLRASAGLARAGREPVVDLRGLAPCAPLVLRDQRADAVDRCGIEPERQNVRIEQQKARNVGRLERAGEARHHPMRADRVDEIGERRDVENVEQVSPAARVQYHAGKALRFHRLDRVFLDAVFGQHDSKDVGPARQRGGGLDDVRALARQDADVLGAGVGQCLGLRCLARARADAAPAGDSRQHRAHALRRRRALHVDDVHAARDRILGLGGGRHAGEQEKSWLNRT